MELGQIYVEQFEENIAEPLRREVRELREEVKELRNELEIVKRNACYCAGCPGRISVL
jgi:archaellum component FlaC